MDDWMGNYIVCSRLVNFLFANFKTNDVNRFLFFVNTDVKWVSVN